MGSSSISCWELGVGSFEKGGCRGAFEKGEKCNVWIFRGLEGCWSFHLYACLHSLETCQQGSFSVVARSALLFASICAQTKFAQDRYARRRDTLEQELKGDQDRSLCLRPGFHFFLGQLSLSPMHVRVWRDLLLNSFRCWTQEAVIKSVKSWKGCPEIEIEIK